MRNTCKPQSHVILKNIVLKRNALSRKEKRWMNLIFTLLSEVNLSENSTYHLIGKIQCFENRKSLVTIRACGWGVEWRNTQDLQGGESVLYSAVSGGYHCTLIRTVSDAERKPSPELWMLASPPCSSSVVTAVEGAGTRKDMHGIYRGNFCAVC